MSGSNGGGSDAPADPNDHGWLMGFFRSALGIPDESPIPKTTGPESYYGPTGTEQKNPQVLGMPDPAGFDPAVRFGPAITTQSHVANAQAGADTALGFLGSIKAYHGSPFNFDQFSMDHIGNGEGNQSYGHGLYFAGNEDIAQGYRKRLSAQVGAQATPEQLAQYYSPGNFVKSGNGYDKVLGFDPETQTAHVQSVDHMGNPTLFKSRFHQTMPSVDTINQDFDLRGLPRVMPNKGTSYEVNLDTSPEQLLDWDKGMNQQPDAVKSFAEKQMGTGLAGMANRLGLGTGYIKGRDFVKAFMDPQEASQAMSDAGIPGIQYLDGSSRRMQNGMGQVKIADYQRAIADNQQMTAGWTAQRASLDPNNPTEAGYHFRLGNDIAKNNANLKYMQLQLKAMQAAADAPSTVNHNYVMFDDKKIQILRKYGLLPGAVTGASLLGGSDDQ